MSEHWYQTFPLDDYVALLIIGGITWLSLDWLWRDYRRRK